MIWGRIFSEIIRVQAPKSELRATSRSFRPEVGITAGQTRKGARMLGAHLMGRTATQRSKKGSEKVLGRVLGKGFCMKSVYKCALRNITSYSPWSSSMEPQEIGFLP